MKMLKSEAEKLQTTLACEAQSRYVAWVQTEENVDFETAWTWCTDPDAGRPDHRLGFKMSDPLAMMAMNAQIGKKSREQATQNFKDTLDAEELRIFEAEVEPMDTRTKFKAAMKRARRGDDAARAARDDAGDVPGRLDHRGRRCAGVRRRPRRPRRAQAHILGDRPGVRPRMGRDDVRDRHPCRRTPLNRDSSRSDAFPPSEVREYLRRPVHQSTGRFREAFFRRPPHGWTRRIIR